MRFTFLGIDFEISYLFASVMVAYIAFDKTGLFISLLVSILVHELSHITLIYLFRCKIKSVKLILGAISVEYTDFCGSFRKILTLLAGPLSNLVIAIVSLFCKNDNLFAINLVLFLYNMLPIEGLDGGSILFEVLTKFLTLSVSYKLMNIITILLFIIGVISWLLLFENNLTLFIILLYIITPYVFKNILKDKRF